MKSNITARNEGTGEEVFSKVRKPQKLFGTGMVSLHGQL